MTTVMLDLLNSVWLGQEVHHQVHHEVRPKDYFKIEKRTKLIQWFGLFKGLQPQPSVQDDLSDAWPPQQCVTWPRSPPPGPPWSSPRVLLQNKEKRTKLIQSFGLFKGLKPQPSVQDDHSEAWPPQQCVTWPIGPPPGPPWSSPKGLLQNREKKAKLKQCFGLEKATNFKSVFRRDSRTHKLSSNVILNWQI